MRESLDFYLNQQSLISRFPQVEGLCRQAEDTFRQLAFPTREDEDWKYTSTDTFCKTRFELDDASFPPPEDLFPHTSTYLMSGVALSAAILPKDVIIAPWADALMLHAEKIAPFLGHILKHQHGFQAQNTAMLSMGLFIYLPKDIRLEKPVRLVNWQNREKARYLRHLVVLEEGSSMTLIEDYQGEDNVAYYTNTVTEVHLHAHGFLKHYKIQHEGSRAYHVGQLSVIQDTHSSFESHSFSLGGQWVRSDTDVQLSGQHAACVMNGIYMTRDTQHLDHHTKIYHQVPQCVSHQDYKGLVAGASRAVFNGIVHVYQDAQKTVAHQQNKNLLLSQQAEVDTKPQLEIYADDVVCTHGATVGQLDEEALFYLATRGIPIEEARHLLMRAFVEENLQKMNHPDLSHWMSGLLNQRMEW